MEIAKESGKSSISMDELADLLEENLCDTKEALASTSVDELIDIGIPKLVALRIKKKVGGSSMKFEGKNDTESDCDIHTPKSYDRMQSILFMINDNFLTPDEKLESLKMLRTIVVNLVNHPNEPVYRSLKKNNSKLKSALWRYPYTEYLFIDLGFEYDETTNSLVIPECRIDMISLRYLCSLLEEEIEQTKHKPRMDPYKPVFSENILIGDTAKDEDQTNSEPSAFEEDLKQLRKEREDLMDRFDVYQRIAIYQKNGNQIYRSNNKFYEDDSVKELRKAELGLFKVKVATFQDKYIREMQCNQL